MPLILHATPPYQVTRGRHDPGEVYFLPKRRAAPWEHCSSAHWDDPKIGSASACGNLHCAQTLAHKILDIVSLFVGKSRPKRKNKSH
jgi:hypothetical protein